MTNPKEPDEFYTPLGKFVRNGQTTTWVCSGYVLRYDGQKPNTTMFTWTWSLESLARAGQRWSGTSPSDCIERHLRETGMRIDQGQQHVLRWLQHTLGVQEAQDGRTRALRLLEEAVELVQAEGIDKATSERVLAAVYERPQGEAPQEAAGIFVTLYAYCNAQGWPLGQLLITELLRVWQPEVVERVRARQAAKRKISEGT